MLIAHVSDIHITRDGGTSFLTDPLVSLPKVIDHIGARIPVPDVVIFTGDLANDGTADQYDILADLLAPLTMPVLLLPGNHDDSRVMRKRFPDRFTSTNDHVSYVVDAFPVRLVGLDTTEPGRVSGVFDDDRAGWLDATLSAEPDTATLIFMHHPPFATGIGWMDRTGLEHRERFAKVIESHPHVIQILAGHQHRSIQTVIGRALVSVTPSTVHQIGLDLGEGRQTVVDEPIGYQLHQWQGTRFVTHTAVVDDHRVVDVAEFMHG